jgi:hypothetical protein
VKLISGAPEADGPAAGIGQVGRPLLFSVNGLWLCADAVLASAHSAMSHFTI